MATVFCFDDHGEVRPVAEEEVTFRPAVYGILIEKEEVLLQPHPATGLWRPPGGILEAQEAPGPTLLRHFQEAAGIVPILGPLVFVEERYWMDGDGRAWRLSALYYLLERPTTGIAGLINFDSQSKPEWLSLASLTHDRVQFGYEAIQAGRLHLSVV